MYREELLDHYKRPRNTGKLETCYDAEGDNPSCGDSTHIYIDVDDGEISEIRHETDGCAVSTAGISIISEKLQGRKVEEVKSLDEEWMLEKLGIEVSPMRMKCAMLGLETVKKSLEK